MCVCEYVCECVCVHKKWEMCVNTILKAFRQGWGAVGWVTQEYTEW